LGGSQDSPSAPTPDVDTDVSIRSPKMREGTDIDPISIEMNASSSAEVDPPTITEIIITAYPPLTIDFDLASIYLSSYWASMMEIDAKNREGANSYIARKHMESAQDFQNAALGLALGTPAAIAAVPYGGAGVVGSGKYLFGKGGTLNSNRYLRIGVGRGVGGRKVFRISGKLIPKNINNGHIDLKDLGSWK
jgi:hypothetical protein